MLELFRKISSKEMTKDAVKNTLSNNNIDYDEYKDYLDEQGFSRTTTMKGRFSEDPRRGSVPRLTSMGMLTIVSTKVEAEDDPDTVDIIKLNDFIEFFDPT